MAKAKRPRAKNTVLKKRAAPKRRATPKRRPAPRARPAKKRAKTSAKRVAPKRAAPKRAAPKRAAKRATKKRVANKRVAPKRVAKKRVANKRVVKKRAAPKRVVKKRVANKRIANKRVAPKRVAKKRVVKKRVANKRVVKRAATIRVLRAPEAPAPRVARIAKPAAPAPVSAPAPRAPEPPLAVSDSAPAPVPFVGVRVGRLPARDAQRPPLSALGPALRLPPRAPLPAIDPDLWRRADEAAARLGIPQLKSDQRRVLRSVMEGKDAVVSLAAGFGKTACAVIAAQLLAQPLLLVSARPLLLREQQDRLQHRRVPVVRLGLSVTNGERRRALERLAQGGALVALLTPEALGQDDVSAALEQCGVSHVVVDDAHCLSEWSDELAPSAGPLARALSRLGRPPTTALLGAATPAARHDVVDALGLRAPVVIEGTPLRENLSIDVIEARGETRQRALVQLVMKLRRPGIVLAPTPRDVDAIHSALGALRIPVHKFHSGMAPGERVGEQLNFILPGRRTIMIAESAFAPTTGLMGVGEADVLDRAPTGFGLGLDKKDVRFLIHWGAPVCLEQLAREAGLAGRDGESADVYILADPGDGSRASARLAQHRVHAQHLLAFVRALEAHAIDARNVPVETVAFDAGLSSAAATVLAQVLDAASLCTHTAGWIKSKLPAPELTDRARRLAHALDTLRQQDEKRLQAVQEFVVGGDCRRRLLGRTFGLNDERCGRCSACTGQSPVVHDVSHAGPRERREAAQSFGVVRFDRYEKGWVDPRDRQPAQLTATLGERVARGGR